MQYLNAVLTDSYPENVQDDAPEILLTPNISIILETWQRDMCEKLGFEFLLQSGNALISLENFVTMNLLNKSLSIAKHNR